MFGKELNPQRTQAGQLEGITGWVGTQRGGSMKTKYRRPAVTALALAISVALGLTATTTALAYESPPHVFSINDVLGGFNGATFGENGISVGTAIDKTIICGLPDSANTCPSDLEPPDPDKFGIVMYGVDSEFGAYVVDFVGAEPKVRDYDYGEGFVGELPDGAGIAVSNAVTDRYKVKAPMGTWCQGLGGNSVKCSTEHYTVLEHVLSCHEVIPYMFADPETGTQGVLTTPTGTLSVDCATTDLDDEQLILVGGVPTTRLTDSTPGVQMDANDKTSVLDDLSVSPDYAITLKDDGKALYRWGALVKFPNDMRMYARLALPDEWKARDGDGNLINDFPVTKAWLVVNHTITNNPNDQLRPEDLENEAAIGVLPDRSVENAGTEDEIWRSTKPCYEGDGDLIDNELGETDPAAIGIGTYYRNMPFAITGAPVGDEPGADPYPFSADLREALSNAYYTTIDREPFEWSYEVVTGDCSVLGGSCTIDYRGCPGPVEDPAYAALCDNVPAGTPLFSGPRWRLKPNKFGQDLPGLEIPTTAALEEPCTPPPFEKALIKYEVGLNTTTIINLLDWDEEANGPSPLATSKGWVDTDLYNAFRPVIDDNVIDPNGEVRQLTDIGGPMSEDFDLLVYIKGDRKPVFLYDAKLVLEYEGGTVPTEAEVDMALNPLNFPVKIGRNATARTVDLDVTACNNDTVEVANGTISLEGVSLVTGIETVNYSALFADLAPQDCQTVTFTYTAPAEGTNITWTAEANGGRRTGGSGPEQQHGDG